MERHNPIRRIRAVLFDFDGTLTEPGSIDFDVIREAVGCPKRQPVLEFIRGLESPADRDAAFRILDGFEAEAARQSRPNAGAEELLGFLRGRGLKIGIITRNSLSAIETSLKNFERVLPSDFAVILTRDDPFSPKPSPEGILAAAHRLGIPAAEVLVVGDFVFDIEAGYKAGAATAWLTNRGPSHPGSFPSDFTVEHLSDLRDIVDLYAPLPGGKLPNDLLRRFLLELGIGDPSLLVAPGVGEDAAAIRMPSDEILVLKSDPVTFATDAIGFYAVQVNINDIAASGAAPRWLLVSLLFPPDTTAFEVRNTMEQVQQAARRNGLILCGGHTEITDAVTRPVAAAQVAGTVASGALIDKRDMAEGDIILMTKALAIEGTSIITREFPDRLRKSGLSDEALERCRGFLFDPGISVLEEARIAARSGKVSAMHDITEGGLSTALLELSVAGRHRIQVHLDRIPVYDETRQICGLLGLDPMGLIGSGSLLIACRPEAAQALVASLGAAGIAAARIGEALGGGTGIEAVGSDGNPAPWPQFAADEIARLYDRQAPRSDA